MNLGIDTRIVHADAYTRHLKPHLDFDEGEDHSEVGGTDYAVTQSTLQEVSAHFSGATTATTFPEFMRSEVAVKRTVNALQIKYYSHSEDNLKFAHLFLQFRVGMSASSGTQFKVRLKDGDGDSSAIIKHALMAAWYSLSMPTMAIIMVGGTRGRERGAFSSLNL